MKPCLLAGALLLVCASWLRGGEKISLFDGESFAGWSGDTEKTWRIEEGAFVGGSLETKVPRNEFLSTQRQFTNFVLTLRCRLLGSQGFVNGGIQFHSQRVTQPPNEMRGYQADVGEGWWGALYDESRRNKVLIRPDSEAVQRAVKRGEWNEYVIRCEGPRIRTWLNGEAMIDYEEPDPSIPLFGRIGLQIHGGGLAEVYYKDIELEVLP